MAERKALNHREQLPDSSSEAWNVLPWKKFERHVFRIQKRIYRASQRGNHRAVQKLQKLLLKSEAARLLAARQVAQISQRKRRRRAESSTALSPRACFVLAKQIHPQHWPHTRSRGTTSQSGSSPLNNQVQACQMLTALALRPACGTGLLAYSHEQSCCAAIIALWQAIQDQGNYVWQTNLTDCFATMDAQALLEKLNACSMVRRALKHWLRVGMVAQKSAPGSEDTILSALLVSIAIHDLEAALRQAFRGGEPAPVLISCASEVVVLHPTESGLERVRVVLETWLRDHGLVSPMYRTTCTHTLNIYQGNVGLHFAGWEVRQYPTTKKLRSRPGLAFKTVIRPARAQVRIHMDAIRRVIAKHQAASQDVLLAELNPLIGAWSVRYGNAFANETLKACDHLLWKLLWNWTRKRHPNKGAQWRYAKYWRTAHDGKQVFMTPQGVALLRHSSRGRACTQTEPASLAPYRLPVRREQKNGIAVPCHVRKNQQRAFAEGKG